MALRGFPADPEQLNSDTVVSAPSCIRSSLYQALSEVAQSSMLFPKLLSNNKICHRPLKPPRRASGEL